MRCRDRVVSSGSRKRIASAATAVESAPAETSRGTVVERSDDDAAAEVVAEPPAETPAEVATEVQTEATAAAPDDAAEDILELPAEEKPAE